jgi:hypothetical protein
VATDIHLDHLDVSNRVENYSLEKVALSIEGFCLLWKKEKPTPLSIIRFFLYKQQHLMSLFFFCKLACHKGNQDCSGSKNNHDVLNA